MDGPPVPCIKKLAQHTPLLPGEAPGKLRKPAFVIAALVVDPELWLAPKAGCPPAAAPSCERRGWGFGFLEGICVGLWKHRDSLQEVQV